VREEAPGEIGARFVVICHRGWSLMTPRASAGVADHGGWSMTNDQPQPRVADDNRERKGRYHGAQNGAGSAPGDSSFSSPRGAGGGPGEIGARFVVICHRGWSLMTPRASAVVADHGGWSMTNDEGCSGSVKSAAGR
jgi:hypothetical protein